jgi:hypothetical protein
MVGGPGFEPGASRSRTVERLSHRVPSALRLVPPEYRILPRLSLPVPSQPSRAPGICSQDALSRVAFVCRGLAPQLCAPPRLPSRPHAWTTRGAPWGGRARPRRSRCWECCPCCRHELPPGEGTRESTTHEEGPSLPRHSTTSLLVVQEPDYRLLGRGPRPDCRQDPRLPAGRSGRQSVLEGQVSLPGQTPLAPSALPARYTSWSRIWSSTNISTWSASSRRWTSVPTSGPPAKSFSLRTAAAPSVAAGWNPSIGLGDCLSKGGRTGKRLARQGRRSGA